MGVKISEYLISKGPKPLAQLERGVCESGVYEFNSLIWPEKKHVARKKKNKKFSAHFIDVYPMKIILFLLNK